MLHQVVSFVDFGAEMMLLVPPDTADKQYVTCFHFISAQYLPKNFILAN